MSLASASLASLDFVPRLTFECGANPDLWLHLLLLLLDTGGERASPRKTLPVFSGGHSASEERPSPGVCLYDSDDKIAMGISWRCSVSGGNSPEL